MPEALGLIAATSKKHPPEIITKMFDLIFNVALF
jgi:hypothetical protein